MSNTSYGLPEKASRSFTYQLFLLFFQQAKSYSVFAEMPEFICTNVACPSGQMCYK